MLLFDIDGVIRDVGGSYRRALQSTVEHYSGWRPDAICIDALKGEGCWNNDWDASLELLRRHSTHHPFALGSLPERQALVEVFSGFYFGSDPNGDPATWDGYICDEPLLVDSQFFESLTTRNVRWGFVSGAEPPSARFLLSTRLGLSDPALIAMGDAPDKPDPTGLLTLAAALLGQPFSAKAPPVAYLGDTVADVQTVVRARAQCPEQQWVSLAVVPPHLQTADQVSARQDYEHKLQDAGADVILSTTADALSWVKNQP
ncbi:MAG: TIGR01548 family HAD-type hydrolase [Synechococcus sp.]